MRIGSMKSLEWTVGAAARTTFSLIVSGGLSSISTFTYIHLIPASRCVGAWGNGFVITIRKGAIRPLTTEPLIRFITVCLHPFAEAA